MRQTEILEDVLEDSLVLPNFFDDQIHHRLNLLVPKSFDSWIPWRKLLESTSADTNLKSSQTGALSLTDFLDECIVLTFTSEYVSES